jgi:hypothetical protein
MVIATSDRRSAEERLPVYSTLRDVRGSRGRARAARRVGISALFAVVLLGALGFFGVRSGTASESRDGYAVTVVYPRIARAGLDAPFRVHVHRAGGFPAGVSVAVSSEYFGMFETQGFFPEPDSETDDGRLVTLSFSKPSGDDFQVEYDAYIQPAAQIGKSADVRVEVAGRVVPS